MIKLVQAQVTKYKSIENSTPVETGQVTVLVGKNESGKTAFLEAINKALPLEKDSFDYVFDYPRKDYSKYQARHKAKDYDRVVELTFSVSPELIKRINNEAFHGAEIVKPNLTFTRSTDYSNSTTIGLHVDQAAVVQALRKPFTAIEQEKEAFEGAASLEEVIKRIDELKLPADHQLAKFAALWKARHKEPPSGWGMADLHVWRTYLVPALPHFLYFDDYHLLNGKINLPLLQHRVANPKELTNADRTAIGLFELAGTTVDELMSDEGYEQSKAKLEAIGISTTSSIFTYWKQNKEISVEFDVKADPKDEAPFNNGKNLYIRVKNHRHGVTVPFDQRSKGFIWFFSFMVWFSSVKNRQNTTRALTLLLDEPGLNLHALAQEDLLDYIDDLAKEHQIIYSTHSPFMVRSDRLDEVRVVEDRPKTGTTVTADLAGSSEESVFPLQAALGYTIAQNLFIAKKNLLVEGPADLIVLQHLKALLEAAGKEGLDSEAVIVPVGGMDNLSTFISLLGANKLNLVVMHDRAAAPPQKLEDLIKQKLVQRKRVLDYSIARNPDNLETDVEDLLPVSLYVEAFNTTYAKELAGKTVKEADLPQHPRIVQRLNLWLEKSAVKLLKDGGFNHYRVAQTFIGLLNSKNLDAATMKAFEALFERVNGLLDE